MDATDEIDLIMAFVKHEFLHRWLVNFTSCESTADKINKQVLNEKGNVSNSLLSNP